MTRRSSEVRSSVYSAATLPGSAREEPQRVDDGEQFVGEEGEARLAGVGGLGLGERVGVTLHGVGQAQQRPLPLGRGRLRPALEGRLGGDAGHVHIRRVGAGGAGGRAAGGRIEQVGLAARGRLSVLARRCG
jgi:hypothetical protein